MEVLKRAGAPVGKNLRGNAGDFEGHTRRDVPLHNNGVGTGRFKMPTLRNAAGGREDPIEFLKSLTDEAVTRDPRFANPR